MASFVDWYNNRHRHSGIQFVTPQQSHSGKANDIWHIALSCTNKRTSETHAAGHEQSAAGDNQR